ncbi:hypothetical protein [Bacillus sinesaloumensis]|uniref:hypothetical protein n=1 Tax=Litchfieldia sinesaloumensis TaxID=1926280 RepID=UPI0009886AF3|nr:hypothetical protein [Bacillus sinesaloumensis]
MNDVSEMIETTTLLLGMWLTLQFVSCLVVVILGNVMVEHVELGVFRDTNNPILKLFTFITLFLLGAGPYFYKKLTKFSWITKRLLMLLITVGVGFLSIIIYSIIKLVLHALFL